MANKSYYVEDKYRCNHPESDFVSNSKGPIEIKQDKNFVEYTHRNESVNYQYDVWSRENEVARMKTWYAESNASSGKYGDEYRRAMTSSTNYRKNKKKNNMTAVWIILFIYFGLPIIFSIFGAILDAIF